MEWEWLLCCLSLLAVSANISAIQTFHNIRDFNQTDFGHKYPRHGLLLLYWLASHVYIDQTDNILLRFDPERQDYGFQHHKNGHYGTDTEKEALPQLPDSLDRAYYSLGSLSVETFRTKLPPYVTQDFYNSAEDPNRDLDRVVVRVQRSNPMRADKVYITEAVSNKQGSNYDPDKTFEISTKLLRQIQALQKPLNIIQALESDMFGSLNSTATELDDPRFALSRSQLLSLLKHAEKHLKTIYEEPGVKLLLILAGYNVDGRYAIHKKMWSCSANDESAGSKRLSEPETLCDSQTTLKIGVTSSGDGYARLKWSGIPNNVMELNPIIVLFRGDSSSMLETFENLRGKTSGSADTFVALNHGLHPRLITFNFASDHGFLGLRYSVFWRGPQFDEANRVIPTEISGYNASLQLYTKNGYACARLYIKKSFTDWETEFYNSWVGFYTSEYDSDKQYKDYQWVSKFERADDDDDDSKEYLIYQFVSTMSIAPGVQTRFMFSRQAVRTRFFLNWYSPTLKAQTVPWETEDN